MDIADTGTPPPSPPSPFPPWRGSSAVAARAADLLILFIQPTYPLHPPTPHPRVPGQSHPDAAVRHEPLPAEARTMNTEGQGCAGY